MDLRVIKTRDSLNKALVELLRDKPLTKITVTELCRMAQINRSTYYLHYRDPYDQYDKLEQTLYQEFADTIDGFIEAHSHWFTDLISASRDAQTRLLEELFSYIKKNALIYGSILPMHQGNELLDKLYKAGHDRFFQTIIPEVSPEEIERLEYFFAFVASGSMGVLRQWIERGMVESPKEMSHMVIRLVHDGPRFIGG